MNQNEAFRTVIVAHCPHKGHYESGKSVYCQIKYEKNCKEHFPHVDYNCPADCPKLPDSIDCTPEKCKYVKDLVKEFQSIARIP